MWAYVLTSQNRDLHLYFHFLQHTDCYDHGNEYKMNVIEVLEEKLVKAEDCQLKCQNIEDCKFWTWNKDNYKCECKNVTDERIPKSVKNFTVVSGPKFCG